MLVPNQGIMGGSRISSEGRAHKKIAPSGGRRENVGVFRVKNHDFTPNKIIFFPILAGAAPLPP